MSESSAFFITLSSSKTDRTINRRILAYDAFCIIVLDDSSRIVFEQTA